jgi:hypothetical protein
MTVPFALCALVIFGMWLRHRFCRHKYALAHNYNCACDESVVRDAGGTLKSQGKKYEPFVLEWCLDCGAIRTVHGEHKEPWDRWGVRRSSGPRRAERANRRLARQLSTAK